MKHRALGLWMAIPLSLAAQSMSGREALAGRLGLKSDLKGLAAVRTATPATKRQVGTHILLLAEKTHEPSATALQQFSGSLVEALAGRPLAAEDIDTLADWIEQVLESAGTSTVAFEETIEKFEKRLAKIGVPAARSHLVAVDLERIGKEVRGPEDFPVKAATARP